MVERDEQIAAYLDGSMSADDAVRFEASMAADSVLREQVAAWQANDTMLKQAFGDDADYVVDAAMLEKLGLGSTAAPVIPLAANDNSWNWRRIGIGGGVLAASLALALVLFGPSGARFADDAQFQTALEKLPSGQAVAMADGKMVRPVLTFTAGDGRFCREFVVGAVDSGIACRKNGTWTVEAQAKAKGVPDDGSEIRTATGADTQPLDAAYVRLKASDPFDGEKEKDVISKKWVK